MELMASYTTEMRERAPRGLGETRVDHPNQMTAIPQYPTSWLRLE